MIFDLNLIGVVIELTGVVLCTLGILQVLLGKRADRHKVRYFILFFITLILFCVLNVLGQLYRGFSGTVYRYVIIAVYFSEFALPCVLIYIITRYLFSVIDPKRRMQALRIVLLLLTLGHIGTVVWSNFNGIYYFVDGDNLFRVGRWYELSCAVPTALLVTDTVMLIRYRRRLSASEKVSFWTYLIVFTGAIALRITVMKNVYPVITGAIIAAVAMYIFILGEQTEDYIRQDHENTMLKVDLMLSQIQPHFLYNSLFSIQQICLTDPEAASNAIGEFTEYLRHNMDSISVNTPIPFEEELEHVRHYVELQKIRFGDDLDIKYDLGCTNFRLPTLTLQPLVENAVRYGVRKSEDGRGTVTVRTREYPDRIEVSVIDNGPGFIPDSLPEDRQRSHVGLKNVRERVRRVCRGRLRIDSKLGVGTNATIILPISVKEDK